MEKSELTTEGASTFVYCEVEVRNGVIATETHCHGDLGELCEPWFVGLGQCSWRKLNVVGLKRE